MKFTFERISEFSRIAKPYKDDNDNKLSYAIKRVFKHLDKVQSEIDELTEEARINNCSTDELGNVLRDDKGMYKFTKEGLKNLSKEIKKIRNMEFEVEPYFAPSEFVEFLNDEQKDAFAGFVIPEMTEEFNYYVDKG